MRQSARSRLRTFVWLMAAASVVAASSIPGLPTTPFHQQSQYHNDLTSAAQSGQGLLQQMPFLSSQQMSDEEIGTKEMVDDDDDTLYDGVDDENYDDNDAADTIRKKHRKGWLYLIRHGEKVRNSDKTGLSDRGIKRSKCLIDVFGDRKSSSTYHIDYILAQDFKPSGQRRRPYETVKPLAKKHHTPLDHSCDRDDTKCAVDHIKKRTRKGQNVLVVWEHARLSNIAKALGVKGLVYPSSRYDIVFKIRGKKVHSIFSEGCQGLDEEWANWQPERKGKHGKAPHGGRLIDDESWATSKSSY